MLAKDTKIYKDAQLLTKKIYEVTRTFKTEYRATIARRLEEYSSQLADIIVEANFYAPNSSERAQCLGRDFIVAYERIFFHLSIAADLKLVSFKQQAQIARILDEIGKQATGWRKSTVKR